MTLSGKKKRHGFTILELLIVISVMAIIATLATGAAVKAIKNARKKHISAMITSLQMALENYRGQKNEWPFKLSQLHENSGDKPLLYAHGADNAVVFAKMFTSKTVFFQNTGSLLTRINGRRMTVKEALERNESDFPLGYADPDNPDHFKFFCIAYNPLTDTIKVYRQSDHPGQCSADNDG